MSGLIIYGWGTNLRKRKQTGYSICPECGRYTEHRLSVALMKIHVCYIPLVHIVRGRYEICSECGYALQLKRKDYRQRKKACKDMPSRKKMSKAFEQLAALYSAAAPEERTEAQLSEKLLSGMQLKKGEEHVHGLVAGYIDFRNALAAQQLKQAEEQAALEARKAAEAAVETCAEPAVETCAEPAVEACAEACTEPAAETATF